MHIARRWASSGDIGLHAALVVGLLIAVGQAIGLVIEPFDARAYWDASNPRDLYADAWVLSPLFIYPPPLALALIPFRLLSFPAYVFLWQALVFCSMAYVTRGWMLAIVAVGWAHMATLGALGPIGEAAKHLFSWAILGNVQWITSAVCVAAFRFPELWAIPLLTKIGPGVGILWHVVRREWLMAMRALGAGTIVVLVTVLMASEAWIDFFRFATANVDRSPMPVISVPFPIRLGLAAIVIVLAARTNRRWVVPLAVGISSPALYAWSFLPIWAAAPRLWQMQRKAERERHPGVPAEPRPPAPSRLLGLGSWLRGPQGR